MNQYLLMKRDENTYPQVTVVLPIYNAKNYLEQCLPPLFTMDYPNYDILVVDDCSSDGSTEYIRQHYPQVRVIRLSKNSGPSKAFNVGIEAADSRYIYIIEHHTIVTTDSLSLLVNVMLADAHAAICYSRQLNVYAENKIVVEGARQAHYIVNQHCERIILEGKTFSSQDQENIIKDLKKTGDQQPVNVSAAGTISFLIDKEKLSSIGYFDETFFIYLNDQELALRVRAAGLKCYYVPTSIVYHKSLLHKMSEFNFRGGKTYPARRTYYISRHRWLIILSHYSLKTIVFITPALAVYESALLAFVIQRRVFMSYVQSLFWLLTHPRTILKKRQYIQRLKCVKDSELLVAGDMNFVPGLA